MTDNKYPKEHDIRIGTLVPGNDNTADYIRRILPHGFESFSITFWQTTDNLDWAKFADEVNSVLDDSGAVISSLGIFGNPLEKDEMDLKTLQGWKDCIDNAHRFGCDIVAGFTGRLRGQPIDQSLPRFKEVWTDLANRAQDKNIRIAFENCDMDGTWETGDWNIAHNPVAWEMMFNEVPDGNLGLEWEPCHQLVSLIDPMPQLRKWASKIFHVHGKDATVRWDVIREYGIHSSKINDITYEYRKGFAPPIAYHRTPGFGDSNWADIITELRIAGFVGSIDIEGWHDPVYKGDLEMTGQVHALNYLKKCRGGNFVPNP